MVSGLCRRVIVRRIVMIFSIVSFSSYGSVLLDAKLGDQTAGLSCHKEESYILQKSNIFLNDNSNQNANKFSDACFVDSITDHRHRMVIDTRLPTSFRRLHTLGAVNLPARQLVAKKQYAHQALLIVGIGFDRFLAGELCGRLLREGFDDTKILLGGIRAMIAEGVKTNQPGGFSELSTIDAKSTLTELFKNQITFIAASENTFKEMTELSGQFGYVLDLKKETESFRQLSLSSSHPRYPLAILGSKKEYQTIRKLMGPTLPVNLYFVDGGVDAFQRYIRTNKQIQLAMKSVPNRYKCS